MNINFFRKNKQNSKTTQKYPIPTDKMADFIKLANILTFKKITKISELRYQSRSDEISDDDKLTLKALENKYGYPFYSQSIYKMDSIKAKLSGFRFSIDNDKYDIFTDGHSYWIGQSDLPNHKVFKYTHEYQGETLMAGTGMVFHILYETVAHNILHDILGEEFKQKYTIDIHNKEYYLTE